MSTRFAARFTLGLAVLVCSTQAASAGPPTTGFDGQVGQTGYYHPAEPYPFGDVVGERVDRAVVCRDPAALQDAVGRPYQACAQRAAARLAASNAPAQRVAHRAVGQCLNRRLEPSMASLCPGGLKMSSARFSAASSELDAEVEKRTAAYVVSLRDARPATTP